MKRHNTWLTTAARAHAAVKQHRLHAAQQARSRAGEAEQRAASAAHEMNELTRGWSASRKRGEMSLSLDQAYVAFHQHLAAHSARCGEAERDAKAQLVQLAADLQRAHGTTQVLQEIIDRRGKEAAAEDAKKEQQGLSESWLLGKHQTRGSIE